MNIRLTSKGDFKKTKEFMSKSTSIPTDEVLNSVAKDTVKNLSIASPTEEISESWSYEIIRNKNHTVLYFNNSVLTKNGENLAIIIDNGHVTKSGNWVSGKNYIREPIEEAYNEILRRTKEELNNI